MAIYKIVSHGGSGLPLNVYGSGTITGRRNVCIWSDTGSVDQQWSIASLGSNQTVSSVNNLSYKLNAYRTNWNCDVYTLNSDSYVNFISLGSDLYRIQLKSTTTRYLTATGTASNSNVDWQALNSASSAQKWKITVVGGGGGATSKVLPMPVNINQKESNDPNNWIFVNGCAVCCGADISSYYGTRIYQPSEMDYTESNGYSWLSPTANIALKVTGLTQTAFLAKVKEQIDLGRPPILGLYNTSLDRYHYIIPFKYINSANSTSDITCLDTAGVNGSSVGAIRTISESLVYNNKDTIIDIRYTSKK
jgi:hypothetical protein